MHPVVRSAAVLAGLVGINLVAQRSRLSAHLVVPAGALALLAGARASGLTWGELGLGRARARSNARVAGTAAIATSAIVAVAASMPGTMSLRTSARYATPAAALRGALVTIPLTVAIPEEILFRAVLDASLRRHLERPDVDMLGAAAFGAWHALGATTLAEENAGIGAALADSQHRAALGVAGAVLATGVAGLGFSAAARATGSVLPGIAVHWTLNSSGALAAGWATAGSARDGSRPARDTSGVSGHRPSTVHRWRGPAVPAVGIQWQ